MGAMDEDTLKLYVQNLEEYVLDEGKIVTYKWLSKELNLHVNLAKQLLHTFLKQHEKTVHATYLLSGLLQDEITHKVLIVHKDDLEKAKSQFKRFSSEHVYSVQKAKKIADLNSLYIIDRYNKDDSDKRLNAICCNEAVERAADEIAKLKIKARAASATTDARAWPAAKKKETAEANKETNTAAAAPEEKIETKKEETVKKKEIKTGGIAAMFAAQSSKNQKQQTTTEKSKANAKPAPKAKSGIAMFFNKNAEKPKEKSKPPAVPAVKDENNDSGFDSKDSQPMTDDEDEHKGRVNDEKKTPESKVKKGKSKPDPVQKEKKVNNNVKRSTGKAKNKRKASDDPPSSKKRKRIVCVSDSEDSDNDIFGKDEDEAPNSPLPEPEPAPVPLIESDEEVIPPTPQGEKKPGHKRERKLKVSTFMDEEGYVVTKRKYVVESCTDSEGEEKKENIKTKDNNSEKVKNEKKSPTSEPPTKKKCSPQKVKQATLMNFFKKK